ncbi:N-acetylmuramoyl-L-alanine amidase family protein [Caldicellulosiruptor naganoensis]|uniref:N-acetylmuramoyl-L-alanine amidase n=1 Tax=Caldicellulosiruptor naganoensis TaxID=29324 RepID=A0ABY7BFV1_9FIRM|nr:N-acetylmuramoyl-L-alanine amidase [Caldicellulosiruptor naganoensis]WAM30971.1 N-acetylmuramoyl-L-alanine amidase [Caldicellulosiruptor naganoensis]
MKVCIDPGHGGRDPGAIGKNGTKEKDVTLAIAKKLKYILEDGVKAQVILTRDSDKLPWGQRSVQEDLRARCKIANENMVDIFISIHCNSSTKDTAEGAETYYYKYSKKGFLLAFEVQKSITQMLKLVNRGIKFANFYVLRETKMPAILVECGFLSNPKEEAMLRHDNFQIKMAMAIANGVASYQKNIDKP